MTRRRMFWTLMALPAPFVLVSFVGAQAPDGRWVRLAPYPQPTQEIGGAVAGGKLYILGAYGANAPGGLAGWFNEYDPATDRWTKKPDIPMPVHHQAMVGYNGKVYVFGGGIKINPTGDNWFPTNRSWEFTPATNTWREIAAMPTKRGGGFATELNGRIFVIGGAGYHPDQKEDVSISATVPHRSVTTNEVYDPATNRWETRMPMNVPRNHLAGATVNGKIYVMGGVAQYPGLENQSLGGDDPHRVLDLNHVYDPATNTWQTRQTMPTPRNHMFVGAVGGRIYVIGGRVGSMAVATGSTTDLVEEYDIAADRWGAVKLRMPTPRDGGVVGVYESRIFVAGGQSITAINNSVSRALEAYDPATNSWTSFPNLPQARHGQGGGVIGNRFHIVSGHITAAFSGGEPLNVTAHDAFEFAGR